MNVFLYNLILSAVLTGVILITQIINYPLFKNIKDLSLFHKEYVKRMGFVVAPLMIIELTIVLIMLFYNYEDNLIKTTGLLTLIIWSSTFLIQVPIHNEIKNSKYINLEKLTKSNWIRTISWLTKLFIAIIILENK